MAVKLKFIKQLYKSDPNICEWYINGNILKIRGFSLKSLDKLEKLINDIEDTLINCNNFHGLVNDNTFKTIINILFYVFPTMVKDYLNEMARKIESNMITKKQLSMYVFNKDIPTQLDIKARETFNEVVNSINTDFRLKTLKDKIKMPLKYDWDIKFVNRTVGTFGWSINGIEVRFLRIQYSERSMIMLTLNEIENCLLNFYTFHDLEKIHHTCTIGKICSDIMPDLTKKYLKHFAEYLTEKRIVISEVELNKCIFSNYRTDTFKSNYNKLVSDIVGKEYRKQHTAFTERKIQIDFNQDVWKYYFDYKKSINSYKLDFSKIFNNRIKYELKQYFRNMIEKKSKYSEKLNEDFRLLVSGMNFLVSSNKNIKYSADINMLDVKNMLMYFSNEYITQFNRNLSPKTLTIYTTKFRKYYDWLISNATDIKTKEPSINYFHKIKWNNIGNMSENTKYIPECVVEKLLNYIDDLNQDFQVVLLIMLNGGLHYKDVSLLTKNCLERTEDGNYILKYIPYKVHKARVTNGLGKYHKIVIHESVANEIIEQIRRTEELRKNSGLDEIFIHNFDKTYVKVYDTKGFNEAINNLIVKYNITDKDGVLWRFTSKQFRKTLAVDMIMNGAKSNEIADYLAHNQISTTNKYYAEVRKMKLADMNDVFWSKEFNTIVPKNQLDQFTEEERKLLYSEFKLGMREVELGYCMKGFWENPCNKESGKINCATCGKICLGVQKLSKWKLLRNSQEKVIKNLIDGYQKLGIKNYKEYREYQREMYLLNAYQEAINKITEFSGDKSV